MLEADDSPVKGKMGYAHMPVDKTKESGWLWSWNLAVPATTKNKDAAIDFIKWATSKDYIKLARTKGEDAKVSIRNIRRKAKDELDKLVKDGEVGEDDGNRGEKELDATTKKYVDTVDELLKGKEAELLEV